MRRKLFWGSIVGNVAGIFIFGRWLLQTDFMFGHYSGPMPLLLAALALFGAGIGSALGWFGTGIAAFIRENGDARWTKAGFFGGAALLFLMLPAALCSLFGLGDLLDQLDVI